jgi:methyl-accepting chemotaxis protein
MGVIVDRIVNVDAPVASLAEQASVQMLDARRAERSYFLLRDPQYLQANKESLTHLKTIFERIRELAPVQDNAGEGLKNVELYEQQFRAAVSLAETPGNTAIERVQEVVRAYEKDLDDLLKQAHRKTRVRLVDDLRSQVGSFDTKIVSTIEAGDPTLQRVSPALQASSLHVLAVASDLENRGWARVQRDHAEARHLVYQAEWVLSIVSGLTLLLSIWISFVLPRQVVRPLLELREAVDNAASGNYLINFELRGKGELVDLARSVRNLIAHIKQTL